MRRTLPSHKFVHSWSSGVLPRNSMWIIIADQAPRKEEGRDNVRGWEAGWEEGRQPQSNADSRTVLQNVTGQGSAAVLHLAPDWMVTHS